MGEMSSLPGSDCAESSDLYSEFAGKHAYTDELYYMKALHLSNVLSDEHENLRNFFNTKLPELVSGASNGKTHFSVLGVGSGAGEMDLHILSTIQKLRPDFKINSETIEPSQQQIELYKANLSNIPDLSNVSFTWHQKTTAQYQEDTKQDHEFRNFDLIHMIQMVYYTKPLKETLEFFISCLSPNGKLIIVLITGGSGWHKLFKRHRWLLNEEYCFDVCSDDITNILDTISVRYNTYEIESIIDITECFIKGSEVGEMLLDVITERSHFVATTPSELKAQVMEDLESPEFSSRKDGKILFDTRVTAIVVG